VGKGRVPSGTPSRNKKVNRQNFSSVKLSEVKDKRMTKNGPEFPCINIWLVLGTQCCNLGENMSMSPYRFPRILLMCNVTTWKLLMCDESLKVKLRDLHVSHVMGECVI
jgi:hypothetical protein